MRSMNEKGMTLVELLIVASMMAVVVVAIALPFRSGRQVWETGDRSTEVMQNALSAMDKMVRELKQAQSIVAVSPPEQTSGYIEFVSREGVGSRFQYGNGYLEYGPSGNLSTLAGPITSLKFTCYQGDGVIQTMEVDKIKMVQIQLTTSDEQGKVPPMTLSSKVSVGNDDRFIWDITDFALFGFTEVRMKNNAVITSPDPDNQPANVGSMQVGTLSLNNVTVHGDVISKNNVELKNGAFVRRDIIAGAEVYIGNATVQRNINTDGNVQLDNGAIVGGYVNYLGTFTHDNNAVYGGEIKAGVVDWSFINPLPPPTVFSASGSDVNGNGETITLSPGEYGKLKLKNTCTLNLSSGVYYFSSISTDSLTLNIDLSGGTGRVQIFVVGDVDFKDISAMNLIGGNASNVYLETHGTFGASGQWYGTVFAQGNVNVDGGNINGAIWCGGILNLEHPGCVVNFVLPDPDNLPWLNPIN